MVIVTLYLVSHPEARALLGLGRAFDPAWFEEPALAGKLLVSLEYAVPVATLVGGGASLLYLNYRLTLDLSHLDVALPLAYVLPRLRRLVSFYTLIAFLWAFGIFLIFVVYYGRLDPFSVVVLIGTSSLGLGTVVLPNLAYHETLGRAELRVLARHREDVLAALEAAQGPAERIPLYAEELKSVDAPTWLYTPTDYIRVLAPQLWPLAYAFLTSGVR